MSVAQYQGLRETSGEQTGGIRRFQSRIAWQPAQDGVGLDKSVTAYRDLAPAPPAHDHAVLGM